MFFGLNIILLIGGVSWGYGNADMLSYITQTSDGGFVISGQISFTPYSIISFIKTDSLGNEIWRRFHYLPDSINLLANGYTYTGICNRGIPIRQMDDGGLILEAVVYNDSSEYFFLIMKTDSSGNTLWTKLYDSNYSTQNCHFELAGSGPSQGLIFCSATNDSLNNSKLLISKISNNGNLLWSKIYEYGNNGNGGTYISKTNDNGFIITGYNSYNTNPEYILATKIDSSGNIQWAWIYQCSEPNYNCRGINVKQTNDGNYIIAGTNIDGSNLANGNSILLKIDSNGNYLWSKTYYGNNNYSYTTSAIQTLDGGYAFCGNIYDSIPNSYGSGVYFVKTDSLGNTGCGDSSFTVTQHQINFVSYSIGDTSQISVIDSSKVFFVQNDPLTTTTICTDVGIKNVNTDFEISIYPNPFTTTTTLTLQGTYHNPSLFIYNLLGQEVRSISVGTKTQTTINREQLSSGMYFYKLIEDNKAVLGIGKMIVE